MQLLRFYFILKFFILIFCIHTTESSFTDFLNKTKEIAQVAKDTGEAIVKRGPDLIPSADDLLDYSKQTFAGLPFELAVSVINKICSLVLAANTTVPNKTPNASELNYVFLTENENITIPLLRSDELWRHPSFDPKKKIAILITGWTTDINDTNTAVDLLSEAYKARGDTNFVFIDTARYVDTLYTWSAFNTKELGDEIGKGLALLAKLVPVENIHVIGHSLGAHISGAAGQSFQNEAGKLLPRITGLDPANPCFREGETLQGLMRGDAEFVDIIHTNSGVLGKRDPIGDADFYPNGIVPLQPGCISITCSHARSYELFAESIFPQNELKFKAIKCNSISSIETGACKARPPISFGYLCPKDAKGNFFFKTSGEKPFTV